jgi:hypothetical protein
MAPVPTGCVKCHSVGGQVGILAPNLDVANERLRPEWTKKWIANPAAMFPYTPVMPGIFLYEGDKPKAAGELKKWEDEHKKWNDLMDGDALDRIIGVRDVIFDLPRITDLPVNRFHRDTTPVPKD